jgi:hypothetical protein
VSTTKVVKYVTGGILVAVVGSIFVFGVGVVLYIVISEALAGRWLPLLSLVGIALLLAVAFVWNWADKKDARES